MRGTSIAAVPSGGVPSAEGDPPPEWAMRKYVIGFLFLGSNA